MRCPWNQFINQAEAQGFYRADLILVAISFACPSCSRAAA
jgi:hypothetical protein